MPRSYGDPSKHRLPMHMRALVKANDLAQRLKLAPSMGDYITKTPHDVRQVGHPGWWMTYRINPSVTTDEIKIDSRGGPLKLRVYRPAGAAPDAPIVLYIHGGGFMLGGLEACAWICGEIAAQTGAVLAAVEYRLAPEHPFPAGLDDCRDALDWLANGNLDGTDPNRIAVAGDSAGGNLSAALCLEVRDTRGPAIAHQTLIYPFLDSKLRGQSWREFADSGVNLDAGEMMVQAYGGAERDNPLVSPLLSPDLSNLPPAFIVNSDYDVLRDDGFAYAAALREAGVEVRHSNYIRAPHGLLSMPRLLPVARQMIAEITGEISRHLTAA
ncbi:MAG TPA: alpha/beta hydrolase [Mycobacteriales bacterium]|nr:alpha/beta hydrolase [Mycobacteriales bacterium]